LDIIKIILNNKIRNLLLASRPKQWTKNLIVFLAPLFAFTFESSIWLRSSQAFISFCFISSSIYLINDCIDKRIDKKHPEKKYRAIASGLVSTKAAVRLSLIFLILSLWIGFNLNIGVGFILIFYYSIQILYCFYLKNIPLLEFFCIASGFIMRSILGGVASNIEISPWFLLSVGMLSLFLAIEKRKAELVNGNKNNLIMRKVLKNYSLPLINKFESVLSTCTVMTYSLWAYGPIIGGAKSPLMIITVPFVILGIFRYQMLSELNDEGKKNSNVKVNILETPENVILNDKPIQIIVASWLLIIISIGLQVR
tara:strand:+ start:2139 stop:3071 length:933 start_codon:yes stop_codon:yes gene_type:complete